MNYYSVKNSSGVLAIRCVIPERSLYYENCFGEIVSDSLRICDGDGMSVGMEKMLRRCIERGGMISISELFEKK